MNTAHRKQEAHALGQDLALSQLICGRPRPVPKLPLRRWRPSCCWLCCRRGGLRAGRSHPALQALLLVCARPHACYTVAWGAVPLLRWRQVLEGCCTA